MGSEMCIRDRHKLIKKHQAEIDNWTEVEAYIGATVKKSEQERLNESREKTGVKLDGITATNPASGEEVPVYIADYVLADYGTGAIMAVPAHDERDYEFAKKFNLPIKSVIKPRAEGRSGEEEPNLPFTDTGDLYNSGEFDGLDFTSASVAIVKKVGGRMTRTYRLRDWSVGRQRYWGVPIPIVYDPDGNPHIVPKEHLPWTLPTDVDFKPTGQPPLAKSEQLKERTEKIFGSGWTPEVETMDTFLDSSWYFLRYLDKDNDNEVVGKKAQSDWLPIDLYFGGSEHTTLHLLYARFWQKALFDLGLVNCDEPFLRRINRGLILGPDGNKMSKSKGNVIDPDEQVNRVGADTVKMYLAFLGPYEGTNYPWDMGGVVGIRRFLERVYGLSEHITDKESRSITKRLHKTIAKVTTDIAQFKFNTAISAMMVFVNEAEKEGLTKNSYKTFLRVLAPFAPHLTEELWSELDSGGEYSSIHQQTFPTHKPDLVTDETVTIGVQINGKLRGQIELSPTASEAEALKMAKADNKVAAKINGAEIIKTIYKPGKIISLIIST